MPPQADELVRENISKNLIGSHSFIHIFSILTNVSCKILMNIRPLVCPDCQASTFLVDA